MTTRKISAYWARLLVLLVLALPLRGPLAAPGEEADSPTQPADALDCVINPSVVADLGSGVPGVLSEVRVDRSDLVRAGDVVARLESGVETAAHELARVRAGKDAEIQLRRVNAAFGQRQLKRSEDLFRRKVISTNDIDERKTEAQLATIELRRALDNRELAELELARAEQVVRRRTIESPITGVVMERFKTIGEYVDEQPVLRVAQLDPLYVEVFVPVERLGDVRTGMRADVWAEALDGEAWQAEVSRVDRVADVASGTYGVRLVLPNPDYRLPAGLRCRLTFRPADEAPLAAVPDAAAGDGVAVIAAVHDSGADVAADGVADAEPVVDSVPATPDNESATPDAAPLCTTAGPFADAADAERHAQRLREAGLDVRVETRERPVAVGHRIVSPVFDRVADAKALVRRLERAGVTDHFLATAGNGPYRVALGLYRTEAAATRRVERLAALGIDAQVRPWLRQRPTHSLLVFGRSSATAQAALDALPQAGDGTADAAAHCSQLAER
ncbi:MAG: efflux RND transporter periplasmic adaptor subunit [Gammaproteobacteria bacterium]|nr:efflux RND transporter periplasmic adaptor subunit [Gammaproteobacteria bacterium]